MSPNDNSFPSTHPSLIAKLQESHAEAWAEFFHRYRLVILNWCRRKGLSSADAEDLTQIFMIDAPRKLQTYHLVNSQGEPNRFRAWLKTVIHRTIVDFRRSVERRTADFARGDDFACVLELALCDTSIQEMTSELIEAFASDIELAVESVRKRVKPETWSVYERYELFGEPAKVIAASLGKTVGAVFVAVNRVNTMLAESGALLVSNPDTFSESKSNGTVPERARASPVLD